MTDDGKVRRALNGDRSLMVSRSIPVDDITIVPRAKGGDGRTVTAYAAVFMTPAEIRDQDGHYLEQNAPDAFNRSVAERGPRGTRSIFSVYNHAVDLSGYPSDMWSVPIGTPLEIVADHKGLLTVTRYNNDPESLRILEAIKNGSLRGMSYTGVYIRSDPQLRPGERYRADATGGLTLVTRKEIALIEYGPTPIPAFQDATVVGVRSKESLMAGEHHRVAGAQPYQRHPGETVLCPTCGCYNMPDAVYCDQCGRPLPGSAYPTGCQAYERQPGENVQCPNCSCYNDADAVFCDQCGQALPPEAYAAAASSSSGRQPAPGQERSVADGEMQRVTWDPDGDGDDDSTPDGDTDHDYWAEDGTQLRPVPGKPLPARAHAITALREHFGLTREQAEGIGEQERALLLASIGEAHGAAHSRAAVDTSPWDGNAAMTKASNAADPAAAFRAICAGEHTTGKPDERQHWALPHHKAQGDPPNAAGVRNALSRLPQTQDLANPAAAKAHLEAHMRVIQDSEQKGRSSAPGTATPAATNSSGGAGARPAAAPEPPPGHSTAGNRGQVPTENRSRKMPENAPTVAERVARVEEIGVRLAEIDAEYAGAALPEQFQAEWDALLAERSEHRKAIAAANNRAQTLAALAEENPQAAVEGADPGSGYADAQRRHREPGQGAAAGIPVSTQFKPSRPADLYDLTAARNAARSPEDMSRVLHDRARWALDEASFPGDRSRSREEIQGKISWLLANVDDPDSLAKRMLLTGSPTYRKAFGKLLIHQTPAALTTEEQRSLQLGTPAAWSPGSYPVPYQLDPTVTLTSNGAINPLRQIARVEQIVGKEWLGVTSTGITVTRGAESAEVADGTPTLVQPGVAPERVQAFVPFSVEVEQDWNGLLAEISMMLADAKDVEESSSFVNGNGTGTNAGGVVGTLATASIVTTKSTAAITVPDDLDTIESAMAPRFRPRACFIAAKATYGAIRAAAVVAGDQFDVWARLGSGTPPELIGYPAYEASDMSTDYTSPGTVPFLVMGDFKQFIIVDRIGMSVELVPHLFGTNRRPTGERGIYALWRNNSAILAQNAFRGLRMK